MLIAVAQRKGRAHREVSVSQLSGTNRGLQADRASQKLGGNVCARRLAPSDILVGEAITVLRLGTDISQL